MPNPISQIRQVVRVISVVTHSGKKAVRLAIPIISLVATVVRELKRKN